MNLVLGDTDEFRRIKRKQAKPAAPGASSSTATQTVETEEKRTLGLTILRGAQIVSLSVESAPPADPSTRLGKSTTGTLPTGLTSGPGVSRPAGRGAPPTSLAVSYRSCGIRPLRLLTFSIGPSCWSWWWRPPSLPSISWCAWLWTGKRWP